MKSSIEIFKLCRECGENAVPSAGNRAYCDSCRFITCTICGITLWRRVASIKAAKDVFCSMQCAAKYKVGKDYLSPEARERTAAAHRGGKKTAECREKMQVAATGERNSQYKNGKYVGRHRENYLRDWKQAVISANEPKCKVCGANDVPLDTDHIKPYAWFPELRLNVSNGQLLCKQCHRKKSSADGKVYWANKTGVSSAVQELRADKKA